MCDTDWWQCWPVQVKEWIKKAVSTVMWVRQPAWIVGTVGRQGHESWEEEGLDVDWGGGETAQGRIELLD